MRCNLTPEEMNKVKKRLRNQKKKQEEKIPEKKEARH